MIVKKNSKSNAPEQTKEKPTPTYLRKDYPYQAVGEPITDLNSLEQHGVLYEIKCPKCEMAIRTQGINIKPTYERMMNGVKVENEDGTVRIEGGNGCIGCGNRELVIRKVDMSKTEEVKAAREAKMAAEK